MVKLYNGRGKKTSKWLTAVYGILKLRGDGFTDTFKSCVVVGIDGGGTHTRVMVADAEGRILSYVERGASSLHKDLQASENVHQALQQALNESGRDASDIAALVAGIAGLDSTSDHGRCGNSRFLFL